MASLDHLILYESEHSALEFKREQYAKAKHADLLTDLLALANAHVSGDRRIIVGVTPNPGGPNTLHSIPGAQFVDDATYQQLVRENIEPQLRFRYAAHGLNGATVGVFTLSDCTDRPYVMRKDFGVLRRGDAFIRKGSTQHRLGRDDLEEIYGTRARDQEPQELTATFDGEKQTVLRVIEVPDDVLPSRIAAKKITAILEDRRRRTREAQQKQTEDMPAALKALIGDPINEPRLYIPSPGGGVPYEQRSTNELEHNLWNVENTYSEDDLYAVLEEHATRISPILFNGGQVCLFGAVAEIVIVPTQSLMVAEELIPNPARGPFGERFHLPLRGYPSCVRTGATLTFRHEIGDVRPQEKVTILDVAIRAAVRNSSNESKVPMTVRLFGRNLRTPVVINLELHSAQTAHASHAAEATKGKQRRS